MSKNAVTVTLMGGLGNQLFQFATAWALSERIGAPLLLDLSHYVSDKKRKYELDYLYKQIKFNTYHGQSSLLKRFLQKIKTTDRPSKIGFSEAGFAFDPRFDELREPVALTGYFQSWKYLASLDASQLVKMRPPPTSISSAIESAIVNSEAVAVHIRRGDYVSEKHTSAFHGALSSSYYANAYREISAAGDNLRFFVFSDEPNWVRENFSFPVPFDVVDVADASSGLTDLRLMSLCMHHVVANSSLSWWAAYLAATPKQIVVAPATWFADRSIDDRDLVPPHWKRI